MRARIKRRQTIRRLEIIAVVIVAAVILVVSAYLVMSAQGGNDAYIGKPVSQKIYSLLYQASEGPYGASGLAYLTAVQNVGSQSFSTNGKPVVVSATGEYCSPCALQRWPLVVALMRFGNFTDLEYMTSSAAEGDYATFAFAESRYQSNYLIFQPYEVYDRSGSSFQTLPANYSSADQQYGRSSIPFIDFAGKYVISGGILPDPGILGTKNWTQIISSVQTGDALGSQIKQAANVITAVICKTTGEKPASVCDQESITALTVSLASYSLQSAGSGIEFLSQTFATLRASSSWDGTIAVGTRMTW